MILLIVIVVFYCIGILFNNTVITLMTNAVLLSVVFVINT